MTMPKRIQRSREKGWRMPEGAVYVGRPTKWGNPYRVGKWVTVNGEEWVTAKSEEEAVYNNAQAVALFRALFTGLSMPADAASELRGKDLACWCPLSAPCHADVLLEWANR